MPQSAAETGRRRPWTTSRRDALVSTAPPPAAGCLPKCTWGTPPQCDGVGRWCRGPLGSDQVTRKEPPGCGRRRSGSPGEHPGPSAPGHAAGRCLCARAAPAPEAPAPAPDPGLPASRTATVNVHVPTAPSPCVVTAARRRDSLPRGPRRAFRSKRDRGRRPGAERSLPGTGTAAEARQAPEQGRGRPGEPWRGRGRETGHLRCAGVCRAPGEARRERTVIP